jgi:hypothetical protein
VISIPGIDFNSENAYGPAGLGIDVHVIEAGAGAKSRYGHHVSQQRVQEPRTNTRPHIPDMHPEA